MINLIIYVMGVSGSGKTTIGQLLSQKIKIPFFDGDDFHSTANKEKMKSGKPLNDDDRDEWLLEINKMAKEQVKLKGAVIACSALKEKYRSRLNDGIAEPVWIFLQGSYEEVYERMKKRNDHYMPVQLLSTQFESLEIPAKAFPIDIKNDPQTVIAKIYQHLTERESFILPS
jgi:carbohydrate kinase (thermoresistant glucokinase family)